MIGISPVFGERAKVTYVGDALQCHICGKAWAHLGVHVQKAHGITAKDYRIAFGLPQRHGLVCDALHVTQRQRNGRNLKGQTRRRDDGPIIEGACCVCRAPVCYRRRSGRGHGDPATCGSARCIGAWRSQCGTGRTVTETPRMVRGRQRGRETRRRTWEHEHLRTLPERTRTCLSCGAPFVVAKRSETKITCNTRCATQYRRVQKLNI